MVVAAVALVAKNVSPLLPVAEEPVTVTVSGVEVSRLRDTAWGVPAAPSTIAICTFSMLVVVNPKRETAPVNEAVTESVSEPAPPFKVSPTVRVVGRPEKMSLPAAVVLVSIVVVSVKLEAVRSTRPAAVAAVTVAAAVVACVAAVAASVAAAVSSVVAAVAAAAVV